MAVGALRVLREAGLRVPDDVALVGFDDSAVCRHTDPALTSVHQPVEEMGRVMADLLLARIAGRAGAAAHRAAHPPRGARLGLAPSVGPFVEGCRSPGAPTAVGAPARPRPALPRWGHGPRRRAVRDARLPRAPRALRRAAGRRARRPPGADDRASTSAAAAGSSSAGRDNHHLYVLRSGAAEVHDAQGSLVDRGWRGVVLRLDHA